jgi:hypothetical protein
MSILSQAASPDVSDFKNIIIEHVGLVNQTGDLTAKVNKLFVFYHFSALSQAGEAAEACELSMQNLVVLEKKDPILKEDLDAFELFEDCQRIFEKVLGYVCYIKAYQFMDDRLLSAQKIYQECNGSKPMQEKVSQLEEVFNDKCQLSFLKSLQSD